MAYLLSKSVFVHTPKTAGQWVAAAMDNAGLIEDTIGVVHTSPDEISREKAVKCRGFLFTFIRHPASWYQSMWAHQMDEQWDPIDAPDWFSPRWIKFWAEFTKNCQSNSFGEFVENCMRYYPEGFVSGLYGAYTAGCSFVGKQENLTDDLQTALDQAGEKYDPDRLLRTKPKNVRGQKNRRAQAARYSPELLTLVIDTEAAAIEKYGYNQVPKSLLTGTHGDGD